MFINLLFGVAGVLAALVVLAALLVILAMRRSPGQYFDADGVRLLFWCTGTVSTRT